MRNEEEEENMHISIINFTKSEKRAKKIVQRFSFPDNSIKIKIFVDDYYLTVDIIHDILNIVRPSAHPSVYFVFK